MKISYRILEVHPDQHSIVVRYWSDTVPEQEGMLQWNFNIWDVPAPTGDALHDFIMARAPVAWFGLKARAAAGLLDMSTITPLIGVESSHVLPDDALQYVPSTAMPPASIVPVAV